MEVTDRRGIQTDGGDRQEENIDRWRLQTGGGYRQMEVTDRRRIQTDGGYRQEVDIDRWRLQTGGGYRIQTDGGDLQTGGGYRQMEVTNRMEVTDRRRIQTDVNYRQEDNLDRWRLQTGGEYRQMEVTDRRRIQTDGGNRQEENIDRCCYMIRAGLTAS